MAAGFEPTRVEPATARCPLPGVLTNYTKPWRRVKTLQALAFLRQGVSPHKETPQRRRTQRQS